MFASPSLGVKEIGENVGGRPPTATTVADAIGSTERLVFEYPPALEGARTRRLGAQLLTKASRTSISLPLAAAARAIRS